jgi:triacylglycerol lipase
MPNVINPVVLVHGINDTGAKLRPIADCLHSLGRPVYSVNLSPNDGSALLEVLASQLQNFIDQHIPAPQIFDLVGFSMGGMVTRYYMQRLGGIDRVEHYVTIAAPHQGTLAAYFTTRSGCVQMRPDSTFIQDLQQDVQMLAQVKFTSIWTPFDLIILPPASSQLAVGKEVQLPVAIHPWMVKDPRSITAVLAALGINT